MATYPPPKEDLPIFDSANFAYTADQGTGGGGGSGTYIDFPVAQGDVTLQNVNVNGNLVVSGNIQASAVDFVSVSAQNATIDAGGILRTDILETTTLAGDLTVDANISMPYYTLQADYGIFQALETNGALGVSTSIVRNGTFGGQLEIECDAEVRIQDQAIDVGDILIGNGANIGQTLNIRCPAYVENSLFATTVDSGVASTPLGLNTIVGENVVIGNGTTPLQALECNADLKLPQTNTLEACQIQGSGGNTDVYIQGQLGNGDLYLGSSANVGQDINIEANVNILNGTTFTIQKIDTQFITSGTNTLELNKSYGTGNIQLGNTANATQQITLNSDVVVSNGKSLKPYNIRNNGVNSLNVDTTAGLALNTETTSTGILVGYSAGVPSVTQDFECYMPIRANNTEGVITEKINNETGQLRIQNGGSTYGNVQIADGTNASQQILLNAHTYMLLGKAFLTNYVNSTSGELGLNTLPSFGVGNVQIGNNGNASQKLFIETPVAEAYDFRADTLQSKASAGTLTIGGTNTALIDLVDTTNCTQFQCPIIKSNPITSGLTICNGATEGNITLGNSGNATQEVICNAPTVRVSSLLVNTIQPRTGTTLTLGGGATSLVDIVDNVQIDGNIQFGVNDRINYAVNTTNPANNTASLGSGYLFGAGNTTSFPNIAGTAIALYTTTVALPIGVYMVSGNIGIQSASGGNTTITYVVLRLGSSATPGDETYGKWRFPSGNVVGISTSQLHLSINISGVINVSTADTLSLWANGVATANPIQLATADTNNLRIVRLI